MVKSRRIIGILIWLATSTMFAQDSFILMTVLYNEIHGRRMQEYITCLERNMAHRLIEKVHVLYDTSRDNANNKLLQILKNQHVSLTYVTGRPTYSFCFKLANEYYPNRKIILSNADIYFNDTLLLLQEYDLTNKFLALTRWNVQKNGKMKLQHARRAKDNIWSQDTWIFQTPLRDFRVDTTQLSTINCDTWIAYRAKKVGLEVINPCLDIQCCHLHLSQVRHLGKMHSPKGPGYGVPWTRLRINK